MTQSLRQPLQAATTLYANPYNLGAAGFYFTDAVDFMGKAAKLRDRFGDPVEKFELEYIDGDHGELFRACDIGQANLELWEEIEELDDWQKPALFYCLDIIGMTTGEAMKKSVGCYAFEDYTVNQGTAKDYADEYIDSAGMLDQMPENLRYYFNMDAFARDLVLNGDIYEFEYNGASFTGSR